MAAERILVIDDSAEIRSFVRETVLDPAGYIVMTAPDGQSGLERALSERPDLIMLDVNMPRMTGIEVLEALRRDEVSIPVILMTFYGSERVAFPALPVGVKDFIRQPLEVAEVLQGI